MKAYNLKKVMDSINLKTLVKSAVLPNWMALKDVESFDETKFAAWILHRKMFWLDTILYLGQMGARANKMRVL